MVNVACQRVTYVHQIPYTNSLYVRVRRRRRRDIQFTCVCIQEFIKRSDPLHLVFIINSLILIPVVADLPLVRPPTIGPTRPTYLHVIQ